jgi:hypothetical protein
MRLLAYNHYLEKIVVIYLLSAACGTYCIILDCNIRTKVLVFWPHSVFGQNHLCVKML